MFKLVLLKQLFTKSIPNQLVIKKVIKYLQSAFFFANIPLRDEPATTLTSSYNALKYIGSIQTHLAP